jgi:hypothetical protein
VPSVDQLQPNDTVVQITIAKKIGAVTSAYGEIVRHLVIQGEAKVPDLELVAHLDTINF